MYPALTLDRFDDDAACLLGNKGGEGVDVVDIADAHAWDERCERVLVFGVGCDRQTTHTSTVEGVVEADELALVRGIHTHLLCPGFAGDTGELQGTLVGFGA